MMPPDIGVPIKPTNGAMNGPVIPYESGKTAVWIGGNQFQHEAQPQQNLQQTYNAPHNAVDQEQGLPPLGGHIAGHLFGCRVTGLLRDHRFLTAIHRDFIDRLIYRHTASL
jgi:hypothetical protein